MGLQVLRKRTRSAGGCALGPEEAVRLLGGIVLAGAIASGMPILSLISAQEGPPDEVAPADRRDRGDEEQAGEPALEASEDDPGRTAGGALVAFMAARDYRTIRDLKALMTPALVSRFDHDSTPFCGKRGIRLSAFHFAEKDLKPPKIKSARTAGMQPPGAVPETPTYLGPVRSLWEEQGEAIELRTETARIVQQPDGLWRIAGLERGSSERLRFGEAVNGVTTLRLVLRAWHRGDLQAAQGHMSPAFLKRQDGREDELRRIFSNAPGAARHAAYQVLSMVPRGETTVEARVKLYLGPAGEPAPLDGPGYRLRLVRKGPRWLLDAWE